MLLSYREKHTLENAYTVASCIVSSLGYQLKKVSYLCIEIEKELDKARKSSHIYSENYDYNIDFLINSFSSLIEYYNSWVINCVIGLIDPNVKIQYRAFNESDKNNHNDTSQDKIIKYLKDCTVGKNITQDYYDFDFLKESKSRYCSAMDFLFIGKNHEIYALNNLIKHNQMTSNYAPIFSINEKAFTLPFLQINRNRDKILNKCLLKDLAKFTPECILQNKENVYSNYISESRISKYKLGGLNIVVINGLEYVLTTSFIGLSIESVLETIKQASIDMIDKVLNAKEPCFCDEQSFEELKKGFLHRKAKTILNTLPENWQLDNEELFKAIEINSA